MKLTKEQVKEYSNIAHDDIMKQNQLASYYLDGVNLQMTLKKIK